MPGLFEWTSFVAQRIRYFCLDFAACKGKWDGKQGLPLKGTIDDVVKRIQDVQQQEEIKRIVTANYPYLVPHLEGGTVKEWLQDHQRLYLGYPSELRNFVEEVTSNEMADFYERDSKLKKQWCYLKVLHAYAQMDVMDFEEVFKDWHSSLHLNRLLYYFILIIIGLGEVPLNLVAFRLFGEAEVMSLAVALALAMVIPACAHLVGAVWKQPYRTPIDKVMLIVTLMVVLLAILGIGFIREAYLRHVGEDVDRNVTFAFICIQLVMFFAGIIASYAAHNLHEDLKQCERKLGIRKDQVKSARRNLRKSVETSFTGANLKINGMLHRYLRSSGSKGNVDISVPIPNGELEMDENIHLPHGLDNDLDNDVEFQRLRRFLAERRAGEGEEGQNDNDEEGG